ncbi:RING-H2 finger protein ATL66 [Ricinus communis]|uniref:RING-H2 finger protein ATL2N, putative n=1 Tax=Ricinus communis TaxID=3988 RepID=B9SQP8_RICCO|nr:RING-H2 finger protein ATL66 [Ricinus communis]EEF34075.1 RING-H2 finger protein ATL2N, putative [Ricinus communis]|eukprot:XP_002528317.1 RING-H2 finger protein ATL66 [Ricinus communis]
MSSQEYSQPFHWHFSTEPHDNGFEIHGRTLFFVVVLFALVILVTLLFLYARWVCHYQHHHFPSSQANHAPHDLSPCHQGLHPTVIKAMSITLHRSSSSSLGYYCTTECCICLGVFEDGDKVKVLPECSHCFHSECVDKWLTAQSSCPLCRASLHRDSAVISILTE